ncbi:Mannitol-1-phosphate 5-dehydrogenase [Propionispora sp. 2/2-37]|uniref:mannitol-1-phosphate 5-dehydrogenase n=1 Tax=Propionispora sp. 2/2-37 TaxID=1677858 RepID=UPI0006BB9597|nr:mannitol-1-phosphate 5-dehydrogenase [Propionispora sp. 2/2-37]CUH97347.1 Mannitol-1-phosphate 5-dehydrogenase [Propionispora sp. 2/2-37]
MNAVHFGAGNIGRGFIGSLLHHSGYQVCFVDINEDIVDRINAEKRYEVVFIDEQNSTEMIDHVSALHSVKQEQEIIDKIVTADIVTTAVCVQMLERISGVLSEGLLKRIKVCKEPLQVIACENAINASSLLKKEVYAHLTEEEKQAMEGVVGFPNVAIDRMALSIKSGPVTTAHVERFYEMIVNESELTGNSKPFKAVTYVKELYPYIERKLFLVNCAHAITAYLGYLYKYGTIQMALQDAFILETVKNSLHEIAVLLKEKHGFSLEEQQQYSEKVIQRFSNPLLADQVTRVARNPLRKLGENERLLGPAKQLAARFLPVNNLAIGIAAALLYDDPADDEAVQLQNGIKKYGIESLLVKYANLPKGHILIQLVKEKLSYLQERCTGSR